MDVLHRIAEEKIRAALEAGVFDDLPHTGRRLELEDDSRVPEELRGSYRLLKGAGFLPPEMELKQSILRLDDLIRACQEDGERKLLDERRSAQVLRLQILMEQRGGRALNDYRGRFLSRFAR